MPASLTTSTVAPASISSTSAGHPRRLVLVEQADHLARDPDVQRLGQRPDPAGVLGGHHVGAAQRVDQPRGGVGGLAQRRGGQQQQSAERDSDARAQPTIVVVTAPAD